MNFVETPLKDAFEIQMSPFHDHRGFFGRFFCETEFKNKGLNSHFLQANHSATQNKGTVRGMHFQNYPHQEVKLVKCINGSIFDVIIDLRKDSPTFLNWFGTTLSAENKKMLYIPKGFAHGFQTLEDESDIIYLVSTEFNQKFEGGVNVLDSTININWPLAVINQSEKDKAIPYLAHNFKGL